MKKGSKIVTPLGLETVAYRYCEYRHEADKTDNFLIAGVAMNKCDVILEVMEALGLGEEIAEYLNVVNWGRQTEED